MVAPGIIDAGLGAAFLKDLYNPDIWETQRQRTALRRFGTGEEIAEAVRFLACERACYITGLTLIVDGGFSLYLFQAAQTFSQYSIFVIYSRSIWTGCFIVSKSVVSGQRVSV